MKIPFTKKEQIEIMSLARAAEGPEESTFWKDVQERMDIREQEKPVVEPRGLTH